ncbi:MAG: ABC transporter substrate-binding protein [Sandaracinobacteroides sp.]
MRGFSLFLAALVLAAPASARPARIVSMNPCIDSVLVRVAKREQVVAISHWSHDPAGTSLPLAIARRFPAHGGTAEEVIALRPDLVLLTPYTPLATRAALARLRVPVLSVGVPASIAESLAQVQSIAGAVGQGPEGAALVAEIEAGLAESRRAGGRPALMRMASGFVPGPGSLSEALMAHAGLLSLSARYGLKGAGNLGLEPLVLNPPQLLITDRPEALHPVVARLSLQVEAFDRRLLNCGGPSLLPAANRLAAIRDAAL